MEECMKYMLLIILFVIKTIGAMDNDKIETRINLQKTSETNNFNTNTLDVDLQQMEFFPLNEDKNDVHDTLSKAPFFQGHDKKDVDEYIYLMKDKNPLVYGQIAQMIIEKKSNKNRLSTVNLEDLNTLDQKIQHGLLQIAIENQKRANQNRKEDLAQAKKDRGAINCRFVISLCASVPATVMAIISIIKVFG